MFPIFRKIFNPSKKAYEEVDYSRERLARDFAANHYPGLAGQDLVNAMRKDLGLEEQQPGKVAPTGSNRKVVP